MEKDSHDTHHHHPEGVELPTPTAWPIIAAFGLTLLFFGLVTNIFVSLIGLLTGIIGAVGWFRDVFPHPQHELVPLVPVDKRPKPIRTAGRAVEMMTVGSGELPHRAHVPTEIHPYRVGVLGGIAGGVVMAVLACIIGIVKYGSIWYPVNLLAGVGVPSVAEMTQEQLHAFSLAGLIVGTLAHAATSILVGLLYAVMVPMLPRRWEWLWGGIIIPVVWSGIIFGTMRMISLQMATGVDWFWFFICQIAFGLVCGYVVFKSGRVDTMHNWSVAARLGVESQHRDEEEKK